MSVRWISPSACCLASFSRSGGLSGRSSLASMDSLSVEVISAGASSISAVAPSAGSSRSGFCSISVRIRSTSSSRESCSSLIACCSWGVITSCWLSLRLCFSSSGMSSLYLFQLEALAEVHGPRPFGRCDLCRRTRLEQPSFHQQNGAVADAQGLADRMIGDEHPQAPLLETGDEPLQLVHCDGIDPGKRLVEEEEAGLGDERAGDLRPAPLAARERLSQRI